VSLVSPESFRVRSRAMGQVGRACSMHKKTARSRGSIRRSIAPFDHFAFFLVLVLFMYGSKALARSTLPPKAAPSRIACAM